MAYNFFPIIWEKMPHKLSPLLKNLYLDVLKKIYSPKLLLESRAQPNEKLKAFLYNWEQRVEMQCNDHVQNCIVKSGLGLSLILTQGTTHCLVLFHSTESFTGLEKNK